MVCHSITGSHKGPQNHPEPPAQFANEETGETMQVKFSTV